MTRIPADTSVVEYDEAGRADVLHMRSRPLPPPAPGEVTVEVICAGISHIDGFIRDGSQGEWDDDPWPRGSGTDFAGSVVAVGDGVTTLRRGAAVIGHVRCGAHATYLNVPATSLVPKPKELSWETAGGLFLAGATAIDTLDETKVVAGDVVVISAAAGGVGSIEAQVARHRGATVIGTCGDRNFDYLRQLGIKPVRYGAGIADRIRAVAGGPVTVLIDNFGQDGRGLAAELGVPDSRYRSSIDRCETELKLLRDDEDSVARATQLLARVTSLAKMRAFTLLISGLYRLDDVAEAYRDLEQLHARGKVVLGTHLVNSMRVRKARDVHEAAR